MKKIFILLLMLIASTSLAAPKYYVDTNGVIHSQGSDMRGNNVIDNISTKMLNNAIKFSSQYASLNAAITDIGSSNKILYVEDELLLTADAAIPSTLSVQVAKSGTISQSTYNLTVNGSFELGGAITSTGGDITFGTTSVVRATGGTITESSGAVTVAVNGAFEAGDYQVFSGFSAGDVTGLTEAMGTWFGVTASASDNSAAMQTAINATSSVLTIGTGTFDFATVVEIEKNNFVLRGEGKEQTILRRKSSTVIDGLGSEGQGAVLKLGDSGTGYSNITIENLTVDGNQAGQGTGKAETCQGFGLFVRATSGTVIKNCIVRNATLTGIYYGSASKTLIDGCEIYSNGAGGGASASKNGISIHGYTTAQADSVVPDHKIVNNTIRNNTDEGIMYGGVYYLVIANNIIRDNAAGGIEGDSAYYTTNTGVPRDIVITGNHLINNGDGISLSSGNEGNFIISGNHIKDSQDQAIYIKQAVSGYVNIANNIIENYMMGGADATKHGMLLVADFLNVTGNHIYFSDTPVSTGSYALAIQRAIVAHVNNNIFDGVSRGVTPILNDATQTMATDVVDISYNTFRDIGQDAVYVSKTSNGQTLKNIDITHNKFVNVYNVCIWLLNAGTVDRVKILNNSESDANAHTQYGVYQSTGTIAHLTIQDNDFKTVVLGAVTLSGTVTALYGDVPKSFTPIIRFGGGDTGLTYNASATAGRYTRALNGRVSFSLTITLTSKGSSTGNAEILGLPVNASSVTAKPYQATSIWMNNMAAGVNSVQGFLGPSNPKVLLYNFAAGASTQLADTDFSNTSLIVISGEYWTD